MSIGSIKSILLDSNIFRVSKIFLFRGINIFVTGVHGAEEVLHDADFEDHRRVHHGGGARQSERHPAAPQPRLDRENKVTGECDFVTLEKSETAELDIYLMRLMQLNRKHPFSKLFSSV